MIIANAYWRKRFLKVNRVKLGDVTIAILMYYMNTCTPTTVRWEKNGRSVLTATFRKNGIPNTQNVEGCVTTFTLIHTQDGRVELSNGATPLRATPSTLQMIAGNL